MLIYLVSSDITEMGGGCAYILIRRLIRGRVKE